LACIKHAKTICQPLPKEKEIEKSVMREQVKDHVQLKKTAADFTRGRLQKAGRVPIASIGVSNPIRELFRSKEILAFLPGNVRTA
jgi:hypothetical protein